eukprot:CAMPEP_0197450522 /NCGR_PEP_ID=MMETSP1175-20131217/25662_1 /TAXON_ID=1003142 /ORGANISM="Triceratium dubium, Strain CCMP147" /LENGTH=91 /DNA_ID=CAMNT_0042982967 /DNA_START=95 /DNA_END=370 /DNA_ORIENTATION=+
MAAPRDTTGSEPSETKASFSDHMSDAYHSVADAATSAAEKIGLKEKPAHEKAQDDAKDAAKSAADAVGNTAEAAKEKVADGADTVSDKLRS